MSRRDKIKMTDAERGEFLAAEQIVNVATFGPRGWPHLMPLWYVVRDGEIWAWTFAKSQKIRNLERDRKATLLVEAGDGDYFQLRGVHIEAEAELHRDLETVSEAGREISLRYAPEGVDPDAVWEGMKSQAPKRVAMQFREIRSTSWDHRKLGGTY